MFKNDSTLYFEHMFGIFDQQFCTPSQEVTGKKFGFIRDLKQVWASNACQTYAKEHDIEFGPSNTIMLESEEEQCYNDWRNSLVIDRYLREDVWPSIDKVDEHRNQVKILKAIRDNLFDILDHAKGDVRDFLKNQCDQSSDQAQVKLCSYLKKAKKVKKNADDLDGDLIEVVSDDESAQAAPKE